MTTIVTMGRLFENNEDKDDDIGNDDIHDDIGYKDAKRNICLVILSKDFPINIKLLTAMTFALKAKIWHKMHLCCQTSNEQ